MLCCIEGSRPLLVEVQSLVSSSFLWQRAKDGERDRREPTCRFSLAVLEKRAGLNLMGEDVFVNIAGGMAVDEPAADLAVIAAVASSVRNRPIKEGTAVFGEVSLFGAVRGTTQASLRVREAAMMGFTRCVLPPGSCSPLDLPGGIELVEVRSRRARRWTR